MIFGVIGQGSAVFWVRDASGGAGGVPPAPATHAHRLCHRPRLVHLLLLVRGQVALWGFSLAEVRSCSAICLAEVMSSSVASPAALVPCTVSPGCRGGCCARLRSEWCLSFFCSPVQFPFSVDHCGSGIPVGWVLGSSQFCSHEYCHRLNRYVSWRWRVFTVSGHARPTVVFRFWLCPFRVVFRLNSYFSVSICAMSGVSVDLTSTESVFEDLVSARVLLVRFPLVFFVVLNLLCSRLFGSWWRARNCVIHAVSGVVAAWIGPSRRCKSGVSCQSAGPIIRCTRWRLWIDILVIHTVRTTKPLLLKLFFRKC